MLLALLKKQFAMIYGYFTQGRSGKKGGRVVGVLMLAVFAYLAVNMVVMSGAVSSVLQTG